MVTTDAILGRKNQSSQEMEIHLVDFDMNIFVRKQMCDSSSKLESLWATGSKLVFAIIVSGEVVLVLAWILVAGTRPAIALGMDQENLIWMKSAMQSLIRASQDTARGMRTP